MTVDKLRKELEAARRELAEAVRALAPKHTRGEWARFHRAQHTCLALERELARSLGDECAVETDWPAPWDTGAPLPHLVASGSHTFLLYRQRERDPDWDGSYANIVDPGAPELRLIATVKFERCLIHKFGSPNDEVIEGHRLNGKGLKAYAAHTVERSHWIDEVQLINSVHPQYDPARWKKFTHYVLAFHDETFECIAIGHEVKESLSTFAEALERCTRGVLG